jgi:signal transduction histidine kinase
MTQAFSRFAHVLAWVNLLAAAGEIVGYSDARPPDSLLPALAALAIIAAALYALDRRRSTLGAIGFLVGGGGALYWFALTVVAPTGQLAASNIAPLSLAKIALVLVGGSSRSAWKSILWCTSGFVVAEGVTVIACLQSGAIIRPDIVTIIIEVGLVSVFVVIGLTRPRLQRARPDLVRAARDEQRAALRYRIEVKAAALMHDTILSDLAALTRSDVGRLDTALRHQIETDLPVLIGEEWLSDPSPESVSRARNDWKRSALLAAVQEVRGHRLAIEVTGDLAAVGRLTEERDVAVGLAVKQCLVNVINHAGVASAEVVIIGSEDEVSVMVIDTGRGFSEQLVSSDRLGLRQSVRRRIEAVGGGVQIWSTPGRGTSVMIRVPASATHVVVRDDEVVDG